MERRLVGVGGVHDELGVALNLLPFAGGAGQDSRCREFHFRVVVADEIVARRRRGRGEVVDRDYRLEGAARLGLRSPAYLGCAVGKVVYCGRGLGAGCLDDVVG